MSPAKRQSNTVAGNAMGDAMVGAAKDKAARKPPKEIPSWQQGRRAVTCWLDEEQFKRVNVLSVEIRKPVRRLIEEGLNAMLLHYDHQPVARLNEPEPEANDDEA
jgi:hypothetical protein